MYLEKIMHSQIEDLKKWDLMRAAKIECDFVPVIAYLEWCGIHLDQDKWKAKMEEDKRKLEESKKALDDFLIKEASTLRALSASASLTAGSWFSIS